MTEVIPGLAAGLLATVAMTLVMLVIGDGPPPTARLLATVAGGDPTDYAMPGLVLHLGYGIVAGGIFAVGLPLVGASLDSILPAVGLGLVYGLALMLGGMVVWLRGVIGMEPDRGTLAVFGTVHVVYGVVLGAVLGTGLVG